MTSTSDRPVARPRSLNRIAAAALALVAIIGLSGCGAAANSASPPPPSLSTDAPTLPGPTIQLTVADGCPAALDGARTVENSRPLERTLLPTEVDPVTGLLCYYQAGTDGTQAVSTVVHTEILDGPAATSLATALQKLSLVPYPGARSCPRDLVGESALVAFHYADGPDVALWYHDSGCQSINNGRVTGWEAGAVEFPGRP